MGGSMELVGEMQMRRQWRVLAGWHARRSRKVRGTGSHVTLDKSRCWGGTHRGGKR